MPTERQQFLDIAFDTLTVDELLSCMSRVTNETPFSYVVTPNVDHMVRLQRFGPGEQTLTNAYRSASICLCDSKVLSLLARFCGIRLPVIAGSDLTLLLFERVLRNGDRIAVVGGDQQMIARLRQLFPQLEIVHHSPPMGLARDPVARRAAAQFIADQKARFSFICVGSPQQELIAAEVLHLEGASGTGLCVGASLEFITGHQQRAPLLVRRIGFEWAHRLLTNPRRLWRRYLLEGPIIFKLTYQWSRRQP